MNVTTGTYSQAIKVTFFILNLFRVALTSRSLEIIQNFVAKTFKRKKRHENFEEILEYQFGRNSFNIT